VVAGGGGLVAVSAVVTGLSFALNDTSGLRRTLLVLTMLALATGLVVELRKHRRS